MLYFCPQYKASKEGTVMGVAVSKISMLTHCQALTQACNYCEGQNVVLFTDCVSFCLNYLFLKILLKVQKQFTVCAIISALGETLVNVLDCKKDMGLWHGVLTVRSSSHITKIPVPFFYTWSTICVCSTM